MQARGTDQDQPLEPGLVHGRHLGRDEPAETEPHHRDARHLQLVEQLERQDGEVPRAASPIRAVRLPVSRQVRHDHREG